MAHTKQLARRLLSKCNPQWLARLSRAFFGSDRIRISQRVDATSTHCQHESDGRLFSLSFQSTALGREGAHLLDGLDVYSVLADGHPLAVYGIQSTNPVQYDEDSSVRPILLLHGRTWSSVPVYHLFGGPTYRSQGVQSRSFMEALLQQGLQPYCVDFRGFGGTTRDETGFVEPYRCVKDTELVLRWIAQRHGIPYEGGPRSGSATSRSSTSRPALLGWSQGALVAQLLAQSHADTISHLILYGSIYDPLYRYPREPLYLQQGPVSPPVIRNTFDSAVEDFTIQDSIPPETACQFAQAALVADPIKAVWKHLYQFNNCDPARVHIPTLVVAGDQDPYAPLHVQQELFRLLGRGSDRTWTILADADHAVHLLEGRHRLTNAVVSFLHGGERH